MTEPQVDLPPPRAGLMESGWSVFLVKVQNDAGAAKPLRIKAMRPAIPCRTRDFEGSIIMAIL